MKRCPNCEELLGDSVRECFNCHYNYSYGRVITSQEIKKEREKSEKELKIKQQTRNERAKQEQIKRNPLYEYKVETVNDETTGGINSEKLQHLLSEYSSNGWRLHSALTNELGKNVTATSSSHMGMSVNAAIGQTVLIFERCIKSSGK